MKRKWLAVGIILLFIGVAIAPSINQSVVKASNDNDLVEVTAKACGIKGYGNSTAKLPVYRKHFFPIYIMNNDDLKGIQGKLRGVISGSGTQDNPYIISGWDVQSRRLISRIFETYDGIHLENIDKYVIIKNNYIHDIYDRAISLENCKNVTVEDNIITGSDCGVNCFAYPDYSVCMVRNNTIFENTFGIAVAYSYDIIIDNTVSNSYRGIICNSAEALVAHNTVFSNDFSGIDLIGADKSLITYNTIYGNMESGIGVGVPFHYNNPASIISNNEIYSNGQYGISCWIPMNTSIRNNSIYWNHWDGIHISDSDPTIINNTIFENGIYGINITGDLGLIIDHNNISKNNIGIRSYLTDSRIITNNSWNKMSKLSPTDSL
jgi:parallel beta-helix repeat protein